MSLEFAIGFETGGLEEAGNTAGTINVVTSPVRTGTYSLQLVGGATRGQYNPLSLAGGGYTDKLISGGAFRFTDLSPATAYNFFGGSGDVRLYLETNGDVTLRDATGATTYLTITAPFTVNQWHFVEVYYDRKGLPSGTTADWQVWIDNVSKGSGSNGDNSNILHGELFGPPAATDGDMYADDLYEYSNVASAAARLGNAEVYRYQNRTNSATPDLGNALDTGVWQSAGETPLTGDADASAAQYTGTPRTGAIYTDDTQFGAHGRHGPHGDTAITGTIKGAVGIWRLRRGAGAGTTHFVRFGNDVDGVTDFNKTLTVTYANYFVISEAATVVPTASEHFAQGFGNTGAQDIFCTEMWAMLLHVPTGGLTVTPNAISSTASVPAISKIQVQVRPGFIASGSVAHSPTISAKVSPNHIASGASVPSIAKVDQTPILPVTNGTSTGDNAGGGTSITLNKPAGVAENHLMIAVINVYLSSTVTITPPSGWTSIAKRVQGIALTQETFWKKASSSEPSTYQWNLSGSLYAFGAISTYTGQDATTPMDVSAVNSGSSDTNLTAPTVTVTGDKSRVICVYTILTDQAITEPGGFFERVDFHNTSTTAKGTEISDRPVSAGATGTFVASVGSATLWAAQTIAIAPSLVGPQQEVVPNAISSASVVYAPVVSVAPVGAVSIATLGLTLPLQYNYRPIHVVGTTRYAVLAGGSGANITTIHLFKSTDAGATWAEQDAANRPTLSGNKRFTGVHSLVNTSGDGNSTVIDVLAQIYNDTTGNDFMHYRFRFQTDTWNPVGFPKTAKSATGDNADLRAHGCTGNAHNGEIDTGYGLLITGNRQANHLLYAAGSWGSDEDADQSLVDIDGLDEITGKSTNLVNYLFSDNGTFYYQSTTTGTQHSAATSVHVDDQKQVILANGHTNTQNGPVAISWLVPYWRLNGASYEFRIGRSSSDPISFTEHLVKDEGAIGAGFKGKDAVVLQPYFVVVWTKGVNNGSALYLILTRDGRFYSPINDLGGSNVNGVRLCYGQEEGNTDVEMLLDISGHVYWLKKVLSGLSDPDLHPAAVSSTSSVYSPSLSIILNISPGFIASTASVPAIAKITVTVAPAAIASTAVVHSPTILATQTVAPNTISSTASVAAPSATYVVAPSTIPSVASVGSPSIRVTVVPASIASTAVVYGPSIRLTVSPAAIASMASVLNPTLTPITQVSPATIASTASVGSPTLRLTVSPAAIVSTASVPNLSVAGAGAVSPDGIASTAVVYGPSIRVQVLLDTIASTAIVPSLTVSPDQIVSPSTIPSSASVGSPSLAVKIVPVSIVSTAVVYIPTINLKIFPASIASEAVVNQPSVIPTGSVSPASIFSTAQVYAPTVTTAQLVALPTIGSTAIVRSPTILFVVQPAFIGSGAIVGQPTIRITILPAAIGSLATVYSPVVVFAIAAPIVKTVGLSLKSSSVIMRMPITETAELGLKSNVTTLRMQGTTE